MLLVALMLQKPEIRAGLLGHEARTQTLPYLVIVFQWLFMISLNLGSLFEDRSESNSSECFVEL